MISRGNNQRSWREKTLKWRSLHCSRLSLFDSSCSSQHNWPGLVHTHTAQGRKRTAQRLKFPLSQMLEVAPQRKSQPPKTKVDADWPKLLSGWGFMELRSSVDSSVWWNMERERNLRREACRLFILVREWWPVKKWQEGLRRNGHWLRGSRVSPLPSRGSFNQGLAGDIVKLSPGTFFLGQETKGQSRIF